MTARSAALLCFSCERRRSWTTRGAARRRTAPGRSARCGGRRGCRCVRHRWRSPGGRGQTPTGKIYRLQRTRRTQSDTPTQTIWSDTQSTRLQVVKVITVSLCKCSRCKDVTDHRFHSSVRNITPHCALTQR